MVLKAGGNVNQANKNGASPLYIASQEGKVDRVKVLLEAGGRAIMSKIHPFYF